MNTENSPDVINIGRQDFQLTPNSIFMRGQGADLTESTLPLANPLIHPEIRRTSRRTATLR